MQIRMAYGTLLITAIVLTFVLQSVNAGTLTSNPTSLLVSNAVIQAGQISVINAIISGGLNTPYNGEWTWVSRNVTLSTTTYSGGPNPGFISTGLSSPATIAIDPTNTFAYVTEPVTESISVINLLTNTFINSIYLNGSSILNPGMGLLGASNVRFNPSSTLAYIFTAAGGHGYVTVINTASNSIINSIYLGNSSTSTLRDIAINPTGTLAYVTGTDGLSNQTIYVVNLKANTVINTINFGPEAFLGQGLYAVAFNPSGTLAYVTNYATKVQVINVATNTIINTINNIGSNPISVTFNPSGTLAYVTNFGGIVNVINVATNTIINSIPVNLVDPAYGQYPYSIAFNPSGTLAYVSIYAYSVSPAREYGGTIVINTATNAIVNAITLSTVTTFIPTFYSTHVSQGIAYNPTTGYTYTVNPQGVTLYAYNPTTNSVVSSTQFTIYTGGIAINPSGTLLYATSSVAPGSSNFGPNSISVISLVTNTVVNTITVGGFPFRDALNPSGSLLYVTNKNDGTVSVINTATNTVINTITVGLSSLAPRAVAVNPQGTLVYVTQYNCVSCTGGAVNVINIATNTVINTITTGNSPSAVAFNPLGNLAYITNQNDGTVSVINVATNTIINTIKVGGSSVSYPADVKFNPQGTLAYVSSNYSGGSVNVINVATNTVIKTITGVTGLLALNPSGTLLYTTRINEINTATNTIFGNKSLTSTSAIAFGPTGKNLYVAANPGYISIFNTAINVSETTVQSLPTTQSTNGLLQLTVNAISALSISFAFNGVTYNANLSLAAGGWRTIYGNYLLYGYAKDSSGSNSLTLYNSVYVTFPLTTKVTTANSVIFSGQTQTLSATINGGDVPPWTYNYQVFNSMGLVTNIIHTGVSTAYDSFAYTQLASWGNDTFTVNLVVTDSAPTQFVATNTTTYAGSPKPFTATPNPETFTNSTINTGQISIANTVISGATRGPYPAWWMLASSNITTFTGKIPVGSSPSGIAMNPSGTLIYATQYSNGTVSVINPATNSIINTITVGSAPYNVTFNPSGNLAYVADSNDGSVSVINVATNTVVNTITTDIFCGVDIAVNPSNTLAYETGCGNDAAVAVINLATATEINSISVGNDSAGVVFNPAGTLAYVVMAEGFSIPGQVQVINVATNTVVNTIVIGWGCPEGVAINPSGTLVYVGSNCFGDNVSVINTATNTIINRISVGSEPEGIKFSPSGTLAYAVNYGAGTISVINVATNTVTTTVSGLSCPELIAVNPSGTLGYVTDDCDTDVAVVDLTTYSLPHTINVGSTPQNIQFNPSGTLAYVANYGSHTISVIDTATNSTANTIQVGRGLFVSISPAGNIAYVTELIGAAPVSYLGVVNVINIATNSVINSIVINGEPLGAAAFSPTGALAYVALWGAGNVVAINVATNTVVNTIVVGSSPRYITVNPAGTLAYVENDGGGYSINVINLATNAVINTISNLGCSDSVTFNPSGSQAYACGYVINVATNAIVNKLNPAVTPVFIPSGALGYAVSSSNVTIIYTASNTVIPVPAVVGVSGSSLAISPTGGFGYVISGSSAITSFRVPNVLISTNLQNLSKIQTVNGLMQLTINAISTNSLSVTFNGVKYSTTLTGSNTIFGNYLVYGYAKDNSGFEQLLIVNTISISSGSSSTTTTTTTTSTITTTISGGGGGNPGAGGVAPQPTIQQLPNSCILITNLTVSDTVRFIINGQLINVTDSYIASNYTAVIVNGVTYVLYQNVPRTLVNLTTGP